SIAPRKSSKSSQSSESSPSDVVVRGGGGSEDEDPGENFRTSSKNVLRTAATGSLKVEDGDKEEARNDGVEQVAKDVHAAQAKRAS
ncbi:unnamed protein product, partial [Amoebophrya sp. A25]